MQLNTHQILEKYKQRFISCYFCVSTFFSNHVPLIFNTRYEVFQDLAQAKYPPHFSDGCWNFLFFSDIAETTIILPAVPVLFAIENMLKVIKIQDVVYIMTINSQ